MSEPKLPELITPIPGPKALEVVARNRNSVTPSLPHAYALVAQSAQGCMIEDVDGNRYLDCAAGIAVCSTGHCHPRVVKAIQDQAATLIHICGADFYDTMYVQLAERLSRITPGEFHKRVFLGNSGAEAVEAALKLARYKTGRTHLLAFWGAFHGRTMGAVSLTASKSVYHKGFEPLLPGISHVPYAYCYRCAYNLHYPQCDFACIKFIEEVLFTRSVPAEEVAAIIVEPIQGEGGYIVPPVGWLQQLRTLCDKYGILLVADEIQSGLGRTGKMFAVEHWNVIPDILCLAKALASGMPLSAVIASEEIMSWSIGAHGSTFGGNPVSCAAALTTLDVMEEERLVQNAKQIGDYLLLNLQNMADESYLIGDVRGIGLMIGVELVTDKQKKTPGVNETNQVVNECFKRGLIVLPCGPNTVRFSPPLTLTEAEASKAIDIFKESLTAVEKSSNLSTSRFTYSQNGVNIET
jgi:4-aminobutyrate aminotransferase